MPTEVIHMVGIGSGGTENGLSTIDVPFDGSISSVNWSLNAALDATGEDITAELSYIATNQIQTNDARGVICTITAKQEVITQGGGNTGVNHQVFFRDLRVFAGERLHMNVIADAGVASQILAEIHLETRAAPTRAQRRR